MLLFELLNEQNNLDVYQRVARADKAISKLSAEIKRSSRVHEIDLRMLSNLENVLQDCFAHIRDTGNTQCPKPLLKGYGSIRDVIQAIKNLHNGIVNNTKSSPVHRIGRNREVA